jgi:hypothetical protein
LFHFVGKYDDSRNDVLVEDRHPVEKRGPGVCNSQGTLDFGFSILRSSAPAEDGRRNDEKRIWEVLRVHQEMNLSWNEKNINSGHNNIPREME